MMHKDDWRLDGIDDDYFLIGETLIKHNYETIGTNDHDHCEFCFSKFSFLDGDLHFGYSTTDNYTWICEECFNDFKELFNWTVIEKSD